MNFHISNLSPLRPRFSTSSLTPSNSQLSPNHDTTPSSPIKIAIHPGEDSSAVSTDDLDSLSDSSVDDVAQDSRDVLVQRLTDLAERLNANVRTATIEALHKQVDEMERVLLQNGSNGRGRSVGSRRSQSRRASSIQPGSRPKSLASGESVAQGRESLGVMPPMGSSWLMSHFQRRTSVHEEKMPEKQEEKQPRMEIVVPVEPERPEEISPRAATRAPALQAIDLPPTPSLSERPSISRLFSLDSSTTAPVISSQVAEDAIKEAEALCAEMATVIESLQTRREESDHLQTVLVEREAVAHQHVLAAAREHEEVVADNEAELRHLRLELRALEVQCWGYVPEGAHPKLDESIRNWKEDWRALREKFAVRKGSSFVSGEDSVTA